MERVNIIRPLTAKVFPSTPPDAGLTYDKSQSYLAIALAESRMPLAEVKERLVDLKTCEFVNIFVLYFASYHPPYPSPILSYSIGSTPESKPARQ
jgi:hypothetical protein